MQIIDRKKLTKKYLAYYKITHHNIYHVRLAILAMRLNGRGLKFEQETIFTKDRPDPALTVTVAILIFM